MPAKFFGQFLLERGKIIKEELLDALEFQKSINVKIGTIALDASYLNAEQVERVYNEQHRTDKMFGELAMEMGLVSQEQLEELLVIQKNEHIALGEALIQKGYMTLSELQSELTEYKKDQEVLSDRAYQAIRNLQNPIISEVFLEVTLKLLRRLGDIEVHVASSHNDKDGIAPNMWNVYLQFWGSIEGTYILSFKDEPLLKVASHLAQEKIWEIDDFAKDSIKEFLNIVVGNSASRLSQDNIKIDISPAKVVTSLGHIEVAAGETETIAISLVTGNSEIQMAVVYKSSK